MRTLGLRHVALNVRDVQRSKEFYMRVLKLELEWEPDPENVYLASPREGHPNAKLDNLALHQLRQSGSKTSPSTSTAGQYLDHIGFIVPTADEVDEWHDWVKTQGATIAQAPKTHRDGARSFYFRDPDGILIQIIHHPPIAVGHI